MRHALDTCPDCGWRLCGGWMHSRRQAIEIPDTPVEIIDHVIIARRCGVCGKVHIPTLSASDGVVGKQRMGVRLTSLVATLAIAKRIDKHLGELFTFVQYPGCPSGNNAAERAIRPAVIARKISGGTRSANGSNTRTTLMSVFGTWQLQGKNLLAACTDMIVAAQSPVALSHV